MGLSSSPFCMIPVFERLGNLVFFMACARASLLGLNYLFLVVLPDGPRLVSPPSCLSGIGLDPGVLGTRPESSSWRGLGFLSFSWSKVLVYLFWSTPEMAVKRSWAIVDEDRYGRGACRRLLSWEGSDGFPPFA